MPAVARQVDNSLEEFHEQPDYPADESTRLDTLRWLNILDTSAEERDARLSRFAKRLPGGPIAAARTVGRQIRGLRQLCIPGHRPGTLTYMRLIQVNFDATQVPLVLALSAKSLQIGFSALNRVKESLAIVLSGLSDPKR